MSYYAEKLRDIPSECLLDTDWFDTFAACIGAKVEDWETREDLEDYRRHVFNRVADLIENVMVRIDGDPETLEAIEGVGVYHDAEDYPEIGEGACILVHPDVID